MSTVPIPQGATVDQDSSSPSQASVPIPQGASVDALPAGQTLLDPSRPELGTTDAQGNIYLKGQKVEPQEEMVTPTPGMGGIPSVGKIAGGIKDAGEVAANVGKSALQPIKDAIVEELPYLKSSPSLYIEHTAKQVVKWVAENPDKALSLVSKSALVGAAVKWLMSNASPE